MIVSCVLAVLTTSSPAAWPDAGTVVESKTVAALAHSLMQQLDAGTWEPPIALYLDGPPSFAFPLGSELAAHLAQRRLAPEVLSSPSPTVAEQEARARGFHALVRVFVQQDNNGVTARLDAFETWKNFWSGRSQPRTAKVATAQAFLNFGETESSLDAGALAAETLELKTWSLLKLDAPPAALTTLDVDADGINEVVALVRDELLVVSLIPKPQVIAKFDLRTLAIAPAVVREPFGMLSSTGSNSFIAWSGRRAGVVALAWSNAALRSVGTPEQLISDGITLTPMAGINAFQPSVTVRTKPLSVPKSFHSLSSLHGVNGFSLSDGSAAVFQGERQVGVIRNAGAALVVCDVDADGAPELLMTSARTASDGDDVRLVALTALEAPLSNGATFAELPALWQSSVPKGRFVTGTRAELNHTAGDEVVLGVWNADGTGELIVVERRAAK